MLHVVLLTENGVLGKKRERNIDCDLPEVLRKQGCSSEIGHSWKKKPTNRRARLLKSYLPKCTRNVESILYL